MKNALTVVMVPALIGVLAALLTIFLMPSLQHYFWMRRQLASVQNGSVRLISRNDRSFANLFTPVTDALRGFPAPFVLDGEGIAVNDLGRPDFEALQARLRPRGGKRPGALCYTVGLLYMNGHSLRNRLLKEREAISVSRAAG